MGYPTKSSKKNQVHNTLLAPAEFVSGLPRGKYNIISVDAFSVFIRHVPRQKQVVVATIFNCAGSPSKLHLFCYTKGSIVFNTVV
jgi:hypothetical protein